MLARGKGLREVIVRAKLQPHHTVGLILAAGQHDDGDVRLGPKLAGDLHAVLARQLQIENDEVDRLARPRLRDLPARSNDRHFDVVVAEGSRRSHLPHRWVVVDGQDVNSRKHCLQSRHL